MKQAYSYLRSATRASSRLNRQLDCIRKYAAAHQLELNETLADDYNVSGLKQTAIKTDPHGHFSNLIKQGRVKPGSTLSSIP
jgi:hypothetical protein